MRLRNIVISLFIVFSLTGCGYNGHFRYPCQDPANWDTADCKPPICEVNGACPSDLVGENIVNGTIEEAPVEEEITNE